MKSISIHRDDKEKLSEIISSVILAKFIFGLISILILILCVFYIPHFSKYKLLYILSIGFLIESIINPTFVFQGIEQMKSITYLSVFSKLLSLILIFVYIKNQSDYFLVPLFSSIGGIISNSIGCFILFKKKIRLKLPDMLLFKSTIKDSLPFFTSRLSVLIIEKTNILLLGVFSGFNEVAYYDLAQKIVVLLKAPFQVVNQVLFPNVSRSKNIALVRNILKVLIFIYVIGYALIYVIGEDLVLILGGVDLLPSVPLLFVLAISSITELVSVFLGAPMLLVMGYNKEYNQSIIFGSLFYLLLILLLYILGFISIYSLAIVVVLTTLFTMFYRYIYCRKYSLI